jgi:peptidoglycan/LPS O-acetylase OafA/YrhL
MPRATRNAQRATRNALVATIAVAAASFAWFEQPIQRWERARLQRRS